MTDLGDLHAALMRGRQAVDARWAAGVDQDHEPGEEVLTDLLLTSAHPEVSYAWFNQKQEGEVGADWLWWFVDKTAECFGVLIQAKKLKRVGDRWTVDIEYRSGDELQIRRLMRTADDLKVPAAYVLYTGDVAYRTGLSCGRDHADEGCDRCARAGVSILAALAALSYLGMGYAGDEIYTVATPLEDLVVPNPERLLDTHWQTVAPELKEFLLTTQSGSRSVAKELFRQISDRRRGQLSLAMPDTFDLGSLPIFTNLPTDQGHMSRPYWPHVFRSLRTQLPDNIAALIAGEGGATAPFVDLAGVAVFTI